MVQIAEIEAQKRGFSIAEDAMIGLKELCAIVKDEKDSGNGRFCRNIIENAVLSYAMRVYGDGAMGNKDFVLQLQDFDMDKKRNTDEVCKPIGFSVPAA